MSERERQVMKKLKEVVDKQRDEIRAKDRELGLKNEDVEAVSGGQTSSRVLAPARDRTLHSGASHLVLWAPKGGGPVPSRPGSPHLPVYAAPVHCPLRGVPHQPTPQPLRSPRWATRVRKHQEAGPGGRRLPPCAGLG